MGLRGLLSLFCFVSYCCQACGMLIKVTYGWLSSSGVGIMEDLRENGEENDSMCSADGRVI